MVGIRIEDADFTRGDLAEFLQAHLDDIAPTAPACSQHALDLSGLQSPSVRLWTAVAEDRVVGTVALSEASPGHLELKSMRTAPACRGRGIGAQLLAYALGEARSRGVSRVSLETGSQDFFAPARRLYAAHGFVECPPFGSYVEDPNSVFMTLTL
ncbi:GNAT family N-acetyltransferase [Enemella dayhoffiae]|uniref:GNAT family N-acetyltransferase n=1 Tax=Enemella dayhoffiae TaxID=2016507 RepID=A0A255H5U4_9ACTN|nr:GNAT family N-acetyltransferase [Enemella dayhoffiae]OYO22666.1 GNAT family N-acetyltransferase [Enemella dayhoffiae]